MNKFKVGDIVVVTSKNSLQPFDTSFKVAEISVQGGTTYYRKLVGISTGVEEESLELLYRPHRLIGVDMAEDYPLFYSPSLLSGSVTSPSSTPGCGTPYSDLAYVDGTSLAFVSMAELMYKTTKTNKQITIMDKITTFAKNLTLSAEEKALRKVGLKTECGDYTKSAESIIIQLICKEREASLVEIANKMIEEDKDTK